MQFILFSLLAGPAAAYTVTVVDQYMYKNIDPILFPGSYSSSHLHTFFGSDALTANTTTSAELQAGCSTAENPNDYSAYWVPTLLYTTDDGSTYTPSPILEFSAYYNPGESAAEIAIPQNLNMTAGAATATDASGQDANAKVSWACEDDDGIEADENGFPSSTCSTHLQTLLYFPDCVNTDTLETDYKSSTYGTDNWCPSDMQSMPQLRFSIRYDLRDALPDGWSGTAPLILASGNAYSSHGDFIMGWLEEAADNMVTTTEEKYTFESVDGPNGDGNTGTVCTTTPTDADPDHGTSDYAESVALMDGDSSMKMMMMRRARRARTMAGRV